MSDPLEGLAGGAVGQIEGTEQEMLGSGRGLAGTVGLGLCLVEEHPDRAHVANGFSSVIGLSSS
jgi:hypothetical protein